MGIITTFVDITAPEGSLKKQLNVILGVVLVLVVITPFLGGDFQISLSDYSYSSDFEAVDLSGYTTEAVIASANEKVEEYFSEKLNKNNIGAELNIYSEINEYNEIEITRIDITVENSSDEDQVRKLVREDLSETEINVNVREEENEDFKNQAVG